MGRFDDIIREGWRKQELVEAINAVSPPGDSCQTCPIEKFPASEIVKDCSEEEFLEYVHWAMDDYQGDVPAIVRRMMGDNAPRRNWNLGIDRDMDRALDRDSED